MKTIVIFFLLCNVANSQYALKKADTNTFNKPTEIVTANDGSNRIFVAEQGGKIYSLKDGVKKLFLDNSYGVSSSIFSGLMGVAFDGNKLYVCYSASVSAPYPAWRYRIRVSKFTIAGDSIANPSSEQIILSIPCPGAHFGGKLIYRGGALWISTGDGAISMDSAQDLTSLLGKVLRIVPQGSSYFSPVNNPYYNNPNARPEIYAYGFRNPFKMSFDNNTLILADVGDDWFEEINLITAGGNYGWPRKEGTKCYKNSLGLIDSMNCDTTGLNCIDPLFQYRHTYFSPNAWNSITGGYVYRGALQDELFGKYIYADYVNGKIWSLSMTLQNTLLIDSDFEITSFGQTEQGELVLASYDWSNPTYLYKIRLKGDCNNDNTVDLSDLIAIYNDMSAFAYHVDTDIDDDGFVDLKDYLLVNTIINNK